MKPPLIRMSSFTRRRSRARENGVTIVLVAAAIVAIIGMAVLSIDLVTLYLAHEEAQRAADTAALAAARLISMSGITGDPGNAGAQWPVVCKAATELATNVAQVNPIAGAAPANATGSVTVTFKYNATSSTDCTFAGGTGAFAINPQVQVQVVRLGLPTLFSRYWSRAPNSVSATATAEAFNPSNSGSIAPGASVVPVNPRCVKPWMIPNLDPGNSGAAFVDASTGEIKHAGIFPSGVIGESFTLFADCGTTTPCVPVDKQLQVNYQGSNKYNGNKPPSNPNLEYLPGAAPNASAALPSCAAGASAYQQAVAGCDQTTVYYCGVPSSQAPTPNMIDASDNPGGEFGDTAVGLACALTNDTDIPKITELDTLSTSYPFTIAPGGTNPDKVPSGTLVSSSKSIVSLPIYDTSAGSGGGTITLDANNQATVTIVGFLQVFVNAVNDDGTVNVTVLNVAGCGNNASTTSVVKGSSPVPVRLITPQ